MHWSEIYCGLTHLGKLTAQRRVTVRIFDGFFVLSVYYKPLGFSPHEIKFATLEAAKTAGEQWCKVRDERKELESFIAMHSITD